MQAGEPIMLVVPESDSLIVDVKVAPQDIDRVHVGQRSVLRFAAFNQGMTPVVDGEVIHAAPMSRRRTGRSSPITPCGSAWPWANLPAGRSMRSSRLRPGRSHRSW